MWPRQADQLTPDELPCPAAGRFDWTSGGRRASMDGRGWEPCSLEGSCPSWWSPHVARSVTIARPQTRASPSLRSPTSPRGISNGTFADTSCRVPTHSRCTRTRSGHRRGPSPDRRHGLVSREAVSSDHDRRCRRGHRAEGAARRYDRSSTRPEGLDADGWGWPHGQPSACLSTRTVALGHCEGLQRHDPVCAGRAPHLADAARTRA